TTTLHRRHSFGAPTKLAQKSHSGVSCRITGKQEVIGHDKKPASIFPFTARSSVWKTRIRNEVAWQPALSCGLATPDRCADGVRYDGPLWCRRSNRQLAGVQEDQSSGRGAVAIALLNTGDKLRIGF